MKWILLIVVAAIAAVVGYMTWTNSRVPAGLGVQQGRLAPLPSSPNGVSSFASDPSKQVAALPFKEDLQQSMLAALASLAALGNNETVTRDSDYLHAVFVSEQMRYRDDFELYFDEAQGVVHLRSQSRVGHSDMGVNRARYEAFAEAYASR
ncbi:DUF1499 domain-containing protein [Aliagarivorans taiwanensis]|uniref:DUF1499 domain-containing protein n=1 Tax=Aliagarivorans taiwanensis TaxID=561966 RepID=UPI00040C4DC3|nr:DUF1499 domain-containing protein [Aliagarivorans taiwanensis]